MCPVLPSNDTQKTHNFRCRFLSNNPFYERKRAKAFCKKGSIQKLGIKLWSPAATALGDSSFEQKTPELASSDVPSQFLRPI
ncbi:hypothetical protein L596_008533 [Steinernema carpocapsae]|uniref:Uncharacterized protein n=1 Tax=Steinernema carpocapsae TaxID=34508 RepID=A0A4U5PDA7_STECR|nr:hypothetical protein L596_008533 [Steinernema carpocapsae]